MNKSSLEVIVRRDVGSVLFRDVGFGVTGWYSEFVGGFLFPEDSIGYFRSGTRGDSVSDIDVS